MWNILYAEMFKKPKWLKPEINTIIYYIHVGILSFVVLGALQLWKGGQMLTLNTWLVSIPLVTLGDIVAHTILKMD